MRAADVPTLAGDFCRREGVGAWQITSSPAVLLHRNDTGSYQVGRGTHHCSGHTAIAVRGEAKTANKPKDLMALPPFRSGSC